MKKKDAKKFYLEAIKCCEQGIEIWTDCYHKDKKIKGYQVSNFGNVRSFWKLKPKKRTNKQKFTGSVAVLTEEPKILKSSLKKGYRFFSLGSKTSNVSANRLVMDSFCPLKYIAPKYIDEHIWDKTHLSVKNLIAKSLAVDHNDHIRSNDKIVNLEYVTPRENSIRAKNFYGGSTRLKKKVENRKRFAFYDSNKKIFRGVDLTRFCRDYKLNRKSMQRLIKKEIKEYKGWTRAADCYY